MAKRMLIDAAHPEETRVVVLDGHRLDEFDFETSTKKQIKGNIYLAKVTRVEPSLQAAFVEYGGNRHGFLAFNEIHPDYYHIPVGDRRAAEARDARQRELAEDARREDAEAGGDGGEEAAADELAQPDAMEIEPDDEQALAADASGNEVLYEDQDLAADHSEEATPAPGLVISEPAGAPPDAIADAPASPDAPPVETEWHEHQPAAAAHEHQHLEPAPDDGAPPPPEPIETVGGDEIEEAPRHRARPFRHYKIQEVIKRRQIMLVQVTKEERGNKGAALTTFLSLAGRYCVLMPNTPRGGGVSRKITSIADRRRLKDLMSDLDVPEGMGVIVRTAGSERSKAEIKRDFEYLLRLWEEIRDLTLKSRAPALIYEEGNLIKRSIRDLYTRDIEEVIIDGDEGHHTAKAFMRMLMPSHAKRIKLYRDPTVPLFHRFQIETQIDAIHSPVVQLRSGGYVVINPTEALVAIDVNSGRSTRERNIEETALKTNLEAAEEIARQLRLRDLAGLIVIDFIDMEEHRNQGAVERKLKDAMRNDRARIQLGRISPFGLLEMSRQRLRPSLLEASSQPCPHCNGTGHIRSIESTALHVLRAIEEEGMRRRSAEISVAVPNPVALYILNHKRDALVRAEASYGFQVVIGSDDTLIPPAFRLERLRALTPAEIAALPSAAIPAAEPEEDEDAAEDESEEAAAETSTESGDGAAAAAELADGDNGSGRRRRRRRRRGRRDDAGGDAAPAPARHKQAAAPEPADAVAQEPAEPDRAPSEAGHPGEIGVEPGGRKRRRRGRRGGRRRRRGNEQPGQEGMPVAGAGPRDAPIAEQVEYVAAPMPAETIAPAIEEPLRPPAALVPELGADSVPIVERGDSAAPAARARSESGEEPPRHAVSTELSTHEIHSPPAKPKRGWWRRVIDS